QYRVRRSATGSDTYEYFPVDQGHSFGSPAWTHLDGTQDAVTVPQPPVALPANIVKPYIDRLRHFTTADAEHMVGQVPAGWLDESQRADLIAYLVARAPRAADALAQQYPEQGGP